MNFFKFFSPNLSILRTFQILRMSKIQIKGDCIEFGSKEELNKNFFFFSKFNKNSKITFSNLESKNKSFEIIDLTEKIKIRYRYNSIIIFNVLEHVSDFKIASRNLYKLLKKNGQLIGSTPFLYRVHGAPNDYLRYTQDFLFEKFTQEELRIALREFDKLEYNYQKNDFQLLYRCLLRIQKAQMYPSQKRVSRKGHREGNRKVHKQQRTS